jgi:hypothetical protein
MTNLEYTKATLGDSETQSRRGRVLDENVQATGRVYREGSPVSGRLLHDGALGSQKGKQKKEGLQERLKSSTSKTESFQTGLQSRFSDALNNGQ